MTIWHNVLSQDRNQLNDRALPACDSPAENEKHDGYERHARPVPLPGDSSAEPSTARLLGLYLQRQEGLWMQRVGAVDERLTGEQGGWPEVTLTEATTDMRARAVLTFANGDVTPDQADLDRASCAGPCRRSRRAGRCRHVPVKDSLPKRMGKFPWEHGMKECGLHIDGGGI